MHDPLLKQRLDYSNGGNQLGICERKNLSTMAAIRWEWDLAAIFFGGMNISPV